MRLTYFGTADELSDTSVRLVAESVARPFWSGYWLVTVTPSDLLLTWPRRGVVESTFVLDVALPMLLKAITARAIMSA